MSLMIGENGMEVLYLQIVGGPDNERTSEVHYDDL